MKVIVLDSTSNFLRHYFSIMGLYTLGIVSISRCYLITLAAALRKLNVTTNGSNGANVKCLEKEKLNWNKR